MSQVRQTHLEYYREHQIAPVRYDLSSMDAHLERRFNLYAKLSLLPLTFSNAKVLEVAAGTGHNSLYIAQCLPSHFELLEPNRWGVEHIREVYKTFARPHTTPTIVEQQLEDYAPNNLFDIVLCENWLGTSQHEQSLLLKLGSFVAVNGVMVVTTISPLGFVPNLLRRFLSIYLAPPQDEFEKRTEILVEAFATHLDTLIHMTRNKVDWVQDNMMNPAYFGLCLSIPLVLDKLGNDFKAIGTSPGFAEDWRWFKGLHGDNRQTNEHFLGEYWKKSHNFLDYRAESFVGDAMQNTTLENQAVTLLNAIGMHEDAYLSGGDIKEGLERTIVALDALIDNVPSALTSSIQGLNEVREFVRNPALINVNSVANMSTFNGLFGRETAYLSLMKKV